MSAPPSSHPPSRARVLAAIAAGGALGAPARYGLAQLAPLTAGAFPWTTLAINVTGSLLLGLLVVALPARWPSPYARAFLATGFCGAYTTFSTFGVETDQLVSNGDVGLAELYVLTTLVVGLGAAVAGMAIARRALGAPGTTTAGAR